MMGKNPAKSKDYALFFFSQIYNANTKKGVLNIELSMIMWPVWLLQDLLLPPLHSITHSLALAQLWNNTIIQQVWNPFFS